MKLAFTNLFAFVAVSMVLVTIETVQASALEDGESFHKRAPGGGGAVGGRRPATGKPKPHATTGGANTGTPKPKGAGAPKVGGGATGGAKSTPKPKGTGSGAAAPKPNGRGAGGKKGGAGAGGAGGAGASGAGGGMVKRQVRKDYGLEKREIKTDVFVEKRAPAHKPFAPSLDQFSKRSDDSQQPQMQKRNHVGMPMGMPPMGMHGPSKRSIDENEAELEKRNHDPHGMHPVKRDIDVNLVKRNRNRPRNRRPNRRMKRNFSLESKSFLVKRNHPNADSSGHNAMEKREIDLQTIQGNLLKRSRNKHGDKTRGPPKGTSNAIPVYQ